MQKNDLIRKIRLISKFMSSQPGKHCNTHTAQYLKKKRQSDNEIWSVNKIQH